MRGVPADGKWLVRFGDKHWSDHLKKAAQDFKFRATLKPRMDLAIKDWHASQPKPKSRVVFTEHEGKDTTGLGPPISFRHDWSDDSREDPPA